MIDPTTLLPNDADMAAMRAAVAAYVTGDFPGIDMALADAQAQGRSMQFIAAAWAQLAHGYDLLTSPEALEDWRAGILRHIAAADIKDNDDHA